MSTIEVTTDEYRKSAKQFFDTLRDESTTVEQADSGFKCITLMYLGLDPNEFDGLAPMLAEHKHDENVVIIRIAGKQYMEWMAERGIQVG